VTIGWESLAIALAKVKLFVVLLWFFTIWYRQQLIFIVVPALKYCQIAPPFVEILSLKVHLFFSTSGDDSCVSFSLLGGQQLLMFSRVLSPCFLAFTSPTPVIPDSIQQHFPSFPKIYSFTSSLSI
jgi:hypothetical protein